MVDGNPPTDEIAIRLSGVCRWFGSTCAVNHVSFDVYHGEVFGFIGPNGAGKTTSMRILATLDTPSEGDAWVDGLSVVDDADSVRRRLGFMPDGFGTYANVNCEEYLDFFARAYGLRGRQRRQALREVMGFTQLDQMATKEVGGLSKGMKQRLCLGRALIHDPQVLILDEPAAGLDPRARIELRDMIRALAAKGKSLLVSSHILTELAEICDRVAIIEQGSLLAVGSVDEILAGNLQQPDSPALQASPVQDSAPVAATVVDRVPLTVQVLGDVDLAAAWLRAQTDVQDVTVHGQELRFPYADALEAQASLLREMIHADIRVCRFASKQRSLEDAFLHVTKGRVQ